MSNQCLHCRASLKHKGVTPIDGSFKEEWECGSWTTSLPNQRGGTVFTSKFCMIENLRQKNKKLQELLDKANVEIKRLRDESL